MICSNLELAITQIGGKISHSTQYSQSVLIRYCVCNLMRIQGPWVIGNNMQSIMVPPSPRSKASVTNIDLMSKSMCLSNGAVIRGLLSSLQQLSHLSRHMDGTSFLARSCNGQTFTLKYFMTRRFQPIDPKKLRSCFTVRGLGIFLIVSVFFLSCLLIASLPII